MKEKIKKRWKTATCEAVAFGSLDIVAASDLFEGEIDPSSSGDTSSDW